MLGAWYHIFALKKRLFFYYLIFFFKFFVILHLLQCSKMACSRPQVPYALKTRIDKTNPKRGKKLYSKFSHGSSVGMKRGRSLKEKEDEHLKGGFSKTVASEPSWRDVLSLDLQHLGEKSIRWEIVHYFKDMTVCRNLKKFGPSFLENEFSQSTLHSKIVDFQRKRRSRTERLIDDLYQTMDKRLHGNDKSTLSGASLSELPFCSSLPPSRLYPFAVHCSDVKTRIVDAERCQVLSNQITVLAEAELCLAVKPAFGTHHFPRNQGETEEFEKASHIMNSNLAEKGPSDLLFRKRSRKETIEKDKKRSGFTLATRTCNPTTKSTTWKTSTAASMNTEEKRFSLFFCSTHFLEASAQAFPSATASRTTSSSTPPSGCGLSSSLASEPWCAIQSLVSFKSPLHLEFYTHHMLHFGLLCYSVWNASSSVLNQALLLSKQRSSREVTLEKAVSRKCPFTRWPQHISHFFPSTNQDHILILGLGGNVLGSCLDACLSKEVRIDVVEIEPAMLDICHRNGLTPPLAPPVSLVLEEKAKSTYCLQSFSQDIQKNRRSVNVPTSASPSTSTRRKGSSASICSNEDNVPKKSSATPWMRYDVVANRVNSQSFPSRKGNSQQFLSASTEREAYHFYLMDANDFLQYRTMDPAPKNSLKSDRCCTVTPTAYSQRSASADAFSIKGVPLTRGKQNEKSNTISSCLMKGTRTSISYGCSSSSPLPMEPPPLKYNLIFLDCYDPHRGTMVHNSCLLTRCKKRLTPGGALLINAHVDTDTDTLTKCFLTKGFASVQILKVEGCRQCIVVCLLDGEGSTEVEKRGPPKVEEPNEDASFLFHDVADGDRSKSNARKGSAGLASSVPLHVGEIFQVRILQQFATYLNDCSAVKASSHSLVFDPEWLKRSFAILPGREKLGLRSRGVRNSVSPCRIWEHYS